MNDLTKSRREIIRELVTANPRISLRELCAAAQLSNESNAHYHVKCLEVKGLVHYEGLRGYKRKHKNANRRLRGEVPMPKLTKVQLQARIEAVVAKAQNNPRSVLSEDADMKVLTNGIKVIIRKPALWGSKAHQPL